MAVRITYAMNVLNGEPFLKYQLRAIYPFADEIVIVEGAYQKFSHAADEFGHSLDGTLSTLKDFEDPEKKIKIIQKDGFYTDRLDMCNQFFYAVTGDVLWQVDVDEFYKPETHQFVREQFENNDSLDRISFRVEEYFFSTKYIAQGAAFASGLSDVRRVFRVQPGDRWIDQRPPTLVGPDGQPKTVREELLASDLAPAGHVIHHPTVLFEQQFRDKYKYYQVMWSSITQDQEWIDNTWCEFYNPLNVLGIEPYCSWLEKRKGLLPYDLVRLEEDAEAGKIPPFYIRDNDDIEEYMSSRFFERDRKVGISLNYLLSSADVTRIYTWCDLFICSMYALKWRKHPKGAYVSKGIKVVVRKIGQKLLKRQ